MAKNNITIEQAKALESYAAWAGDDWKNKLRADWMRAGSSWSGEWAYLQQLRNDPGFNLSEWRLANPGVGKLKSKLLR